MGAVAVRLGTGATTPAQRHGAPRGVRGILPDRADGDASTREQWAVRADGDARTVPDAPRRGSPAAGRRERLGLRRNRWLGTGDRARERLSERARSVLPRAQNITGNETIEHDSGRGPEQDVVAKLRLRAHERHHHLVACHLLMQGVGQHVLVEVGGHLIGQPDPTHALGVAAHGDRRGHLDGRQMPHDCAPQPSVQPEHHDRVIRREHARRHPVDIAARPGVQARRPHRDRKQLGMQARQLAVSVFVALDLHDRGLRLSAQAGDRERVRVRLRELVDGLEHQKLTYLPQIGA